jgi:hypothetical protein
MTEYNRSLYRSVYLSVPLFILFPFYTHFLALNAGLITLIEDLLYLENNYIIQHRDFNETWQTLNLIITAVSQFCTSHPRIEIKNSVMKQNQPRSR